MGLASFHPSRNGERKENLQGQCSGQKHGEDTFTGRDIEHGPC